MRMKKPTGPKDGYAPFADKRGYPGDKLRDLGRAKSRWGAKDRKVRGKKSDSSAVGLLGGADGKEYTEERWIEGPVVSTPELHSVMCIDCKPQCSGKWCVGKTDLEVRAPNAKWVFSGLPQHIKIQCVKNNQKAWEWNVYPKGPRYKVTRNNPDAIDAVLWTGSRSVRVRLRAFARFYP